MLQLWLWLLAPSGLFTDRRMAWKFLSLAFMALHHPTEPAFPAFTTHSTANTGSLCTTSSVFMFFPLGGDPPLCPVSCSKGMKICFKKIFGLKLSLCKFSKCTKVKSGTNSCIYHLALVIIDLISYMYPNLLTPVDCFEANPKQLINSSVNSSLCISKIHNVL